jgi:hypothetical protein
MISAPLSRTHLSDASPPRKDCGSAEPWTDAVALTGPEDDKESPDKSLTGPVGSLAVVIVVVAQKGTEQFQDRELAACRPWVAS